MTQAISFAAGTASVLLRKQQKELRRRSGSSFVPLRFIGVKGRQLIIARGIVCWVGRFLHTHLLQSIKEIISRDDILNGFRMHEQLNNFFISYRDIRGTMKFQFWYVIKIVQRIMYGFPSNRTMFVKIFSQCIAYYCKGSIFK